jgi:hypothetical protein
MTDKDMMGFDAMAARLSGKQPPRAVVTINKPMNLGGNAKTADMSFEQQAAMQRQMQGMPTSPTDPKRWTR